MRAMRANAAGLWPDADYYPVLKKKKIKQIQFVEILSFYGSSNLILLLQFSISPISTMIVYLERKLNILQIAWIENYRRRRLD